MEEKIVTSQNLSILKKQHINKWVALSSDYKKLLAVADTLVEAVQKAGSDTKIVMKVLPNLPYIPFSVK